MPTTLAGWSPFAIAAAVAISAGIVLLVAYAVRRGLVHRELEGIESDIPERAERAISGPAASVHGVRSGRNLGVAGTALLVIGLFLGLATAIAGWGNGPTASAAPGTGPQDCAQGWNGCPQATPLASPKP